MIFQKENVENIYGLTPLQEGLYFHSFYENRPGMYLEQLRFRLEGAPEIATVKEAFAELIRRHDTFRTVFVEKPGHGLLQVLLRQMAFDIHYEDLSGQAGQAAYLDAFTRRDGQRPFNLNKDVLLRVALFKLAPDQYEMVWTHHHLLMDGWSLVLILNEYQTIYGQLVRNTYRRPAAPKPFVDYVRWVKGQDPEKAKEFWRAYLRGYQGVAGIPGGREAAGPEDAGTESVAFGLSAEKTAALNALALRSKVTLNTLAITLWGLLMCKYNNTRDIALGMVCAGRPGELPGVEHMVGLFINTVPVRICYEPGTGFAALLGAVQKHLIAIEKHQYFPLKEIQTLHGGKQDFFDQLLTIEKYSVVDGREPAAGTTGPGELKILRSEITERTHYPFNVTIRPDKTMQFRFDFDAGRYDKEFIHNIEGHLNVLADHILADADAPVEGLSILSGREKAQLLHAFSRREALPEGTFVSLFEQTVRQQPERTAVQHGERRISYDHLNRMGNQLAHYLLDRQLVDARVPVGIMLPRGPELIGAMLAVWKCGGFYIPIDPSYPADRVQTILRLAGSALLITDAQTWPPDGEAAQPYRTVRLDHLAGRLAGQDAGNVAVSVGRDQLAYVIYTSGSTGQPKGAMIEHRGMLNHLVSKLNTLGMDARTTVAQTASQSFDICIWQIFAPLLAGGTTVVYGNETVLNPPALLRQLAEDAIQLLEVVPSYLAVLLEVLRQEPHRLPALRMVLVTGETVQKSLVSAWFQCFPGVKLVNAYGPTEASDDITHFVMAGPPPGEHVPIGEPISNVHIYIVDQDGNLCPVGVKGEIWVSGVAVGRGYLNDAHTTARVFRTGDPFTGQQDARLYRTGDTGRYLPGGVIAYAGRTDDQVKIKGYRVELGEIESALSAVEGVKAAAVIRKTDAQGNAFLAAFLVMGGSTDVAGCKAALKKQLPGYMVPAYFTAVDELPLTGNGKIDRKALAALALAPQAAGDAPEARYPEMTRLLIGIAEQVLAKSPLAAGDNFFDAGGDSIKAIQICTRLRSAGYLMEVQDLFRNPVLGEAAALVRRLEKVADQSPVTGPVPLVPAQLDLLTGKTDPHHYNQSVMLYRPEGFDTAALQRVLEKMLEHHDALRLTYQTAGGRPRQENGGPGRSLRIDTCDLREDPEALATLEKAANALQAGFALAEGPLVKAGLFRLRDGDRLLLIIHHLVVDAVSWGILLEDLHTLYGQCLQNQPLRLPAKTDSFKLFAERLTSPATVEGLRDELPYWEALLGHPFEPLPVGGADGSNRIRDTRVVHFSLDPARTGRLLTLAGRTPGTQAESMLLAAMTAAVNQTFGINQVLVALEAHGRHKVFADLDVTRTVGWFGYEYPVLLTAEDPADFTQLLARVKNSLESTPGKGLGYGILKHFSPAFAGRSGPLPRPQIGFNYLGQYGQPAGRQLFTLAGEPTGMDLSPDGERSYPLEVNCHVLNGTLTVSILGEKAGPAGDAVGAFSEAFKGILSALIDFCAEAAQSAAAGPADQPEQVGGAALDQLRRHYPVEDAYPLTPTQEGILFHSLMDESNQTYFEQYAYRLEGDLQVPVFEKSLAVLSDRHAVLRTLLVTDTGNDRPFQAVLREWKPAFDFEDIRHLRDPHERQRYVEAFRAKDRENAFVLDRCALMRIKLIQVDDQCFELVWSFHHILLDGWCIGVLIKEFNHIYACFLSGQPRRLPPVTPYRAYIDWLEKQDYQAAGTYWTDYLRGYDEVAPIPQRQYPAPTPAYSQRELAETVSGPLSRRIGTAARRSGVTVNTFMQAAWGVLLAKYNNLSDVVFGTVVAGRPTEIPGIESVVGLFINTVPVRVKYDREATFEQVLQTCQRDALNGHAYHFYPLAQVFAGNKFKNRLIDHLLVFENYPFGTGPGEAPDPAALRVTQVGLYEKTNYPFNLLITQEEQLVIKAVFDESTYSVAFVAGLLTHYLNILEQVATDASRRVAQVETLTAEQVRETIAADRPAIGFPHQTLPALFEKQVRENPHRTALKSGDSFLTYACLNARSNRLAHYLIGELGVGPGDLVGLLIDRSADMVIALMAILKAGAAYVPVDVKYPKDRIHYSLYEDANVKTVLINDETVARQKELTHYLHVDDPAILSYGAHNPVTALCPHDLAYLIYTSGSTGKPKGVMVDHRNVVRLLFNDSFHESMDFGFSERDVWTLFHTICFDVSVWEVFGALLRGARLVVVSEEVSKDLPRFAQLLDREQVTVLSQTPTVLNNLSPEVFKEGNAFRLNLNCIVLAGEALSPASLKQWPRYYPQTKLINMYGITEVTVHTTYKLIGAREIALDESNIGKAIPTTSLYIMDAHGKLMPRETVGEIVVGGEGVARGYLNRDALTKERFRDNPYNPREKLYFSGDLGVALPDGDVRFVGRRDAQIKIRGFRVELKEIEMTLGRLEGVEEARVIARKGNDGDVQILAFLVAARAIDKKAIISHLKQFLPDHMIPFAFVAVDKFPLTPNGKLDQKKLIERFESEANTEAPTPVEAGPVEGALRAIWQELLDRKNIGLHESFFEVGGHSLKAIRLVALIKQRMGASVGLQDVFDHPTISHLAGLIAGAETGSRENIPAIEDQEYYEASHPQTRLWLLNQLGGSLKTHNITAAYQVTGKLEATAFKRAFAALVSRHESLRTVFVLVKGQLKQKVAAPGLPGPAVTCVDLSSRKNKHEAALAMLNEECAHQFDVAKGPLIRAMLLTTGPEQHYLAVTLHHLVGDGVSVEVLMRELLAGYHAAGAGEPAGPAPLKIQYRDYTAWQKARLGSEEGRHHREYWHRQFEDQPPAVPLLTDYPRPAVRTTRGAVLRSGLGRATTDALRRTARQRNGSLFMTLLTAVDILLYKYTGQRDLTVGTAVAGREHPDLDGQIGMFVNMLPLRVRLDAYETVGTLLDRVKATALEAFTHQAYPFEMLIDELNLVNDRSRSRLYDVVVLFNDVETGDLEKSSGSRLKVRPLPLASVQSKCDLLFDFTETDAEVVLSVEYNADLFLPATIEKIIWHVQQIIEAVTGDAHTPVAGIALPVAESEQADLLAMMQRMEETGAVAG